LETTDDCRKLLDSRREIEKQHRFVVSVPRNRIGYPDWRPHIRGEPLQISYQHSRYPSTGSNLNEMKSHYGKAGHSNNQEQRLGTKHRKYSTSKQGVFPELEAVQERDYGHPFHKHSSVLHEEQDGIFAAISVVPAPDSSKADTEGKNVYSDSGAANDEKSSLTVDKAA
jgi:hypothetical protein